MLTTAATQANTTQVNQQGTNSQDTNTLNTRYASTVDTDRVRLSPVVICVRHSTYNMNNMPLNLIFFYFTNKQHQHATCNTKQRTSHAPVKKQRHTLQETVGWHMRSHPPGWCEPPSTRVGAFGDVSRHVFAQTASHCTQQAHC
jgi:hypothetical protein